jgi:hypothetical protein
MHRRLIRHYAWGVAVAGGLLTSASAQDAPAQSVASAVVASPAASSGSTKTAPPVRESDENPIDAASLLPDLPPLPPRRASLVGGTLEKVDHVRDQFTIRIFGGGKMKILFDPRTSILQGDGFGAASDLRIGDRVYVDTLLDHDKIFARNIRLANTGASGKSQGVVVSYRADRGELLVRDQLSPEPVRLTIDSRTEFVESGKLASANDLVPGTLVSVDFATQKSGRNAQQISILAVPGNTFTFAGQVVLIDLHLGLLVVNSSNDHKTYEIHLDPSTLNVDDRLRVGADVTAVANFDGTQYEARSLTVNSR